MQKNRSMSDRMAVAIDHKSGKYLKMSHMTSPNRCVIEHQFLIIKGSRYEYSYIN